MNLDHQLIFCEKYSICPNELLLLEIILIAQEGDDPELVKKYFMSSPCARGSVKDNLVHMLNKGIINKSYKLPNVGEQLDLNIIPLNKNIIKDFYKASYDIGKELFENYPMFTTINGCTVSLRGISKKFDSLEDFYRFYGKTIRWKPDMHKHIMELLQWAKDNTNFINMSIANFVIEHKWEEIEALQKGDIANVDFNAIRQL